MAVEAFLDIVLRCIVDVAHPERVYLFGSHARGDAGPDSDYDLMVLVRDPTEDLGALNRRVREALWDARMQRPPDANGAVDILLWPAEQFDRWAHLVAGLPATILREGKLLHAA